MRARSKSVWNSSENSFVLVAWPVPKYLHIYGPLDLRSQKPTWPYNRHHLDWEVGACLVKVGMNTLVGMVRRGMDTLVQFHPLFQALFVARHRGQGLSTSLYSATKYIIYTGISWPFSVGKRQPENTENSTIDRFRALASWSISGLDLELQSSFSIRYKRQNYFPVLQCILKCGIGKKTPIKHWWWFWPKCVG